MADEAWIRVHLGVDSSKIGITVKRKKKHRRGATLLSARALLSFSRSLFASFHPKGREINPKGREINPKGREIKREDVRRERGT